MPDNDTPIRPHVNIREMPTNAFVDGVYNLVNPQIGLTRGGDPYLKCLMRDASGEMPARKWRFSEKEMAEITRTGFVRIAGTTELYNEQPQLKIERIEAIDVSDEDLAHLLPMTRRHIGDMFTRLKSLLESLEHPAIKALVGAYLGDEQMMGLFRRAPAATALHHAWLGGLLEHTLQLLELADRMLPLYPDLNRDLVLTGLFLHDLGKTQELSWERGFAYTADGNLIGHVVRGAILLQVKAAIAARDSGCRLPVEALRVLQHIVLSHHGQLEFGAAKLPATPEAIFVAHLDNLDARTQMALTATRGPDSGRGEPQSDFTEKVWALETRLYRPDPLKATSAPG